VHYFHLCKEKNAKTPLERRICLILGLVQGRNCCVDKDSGVAVMVWCPGVFSLYFELFSSWFLPYFLFLFLSFLFSFPPATSWFTTLHFEFFWVLIFSLLFFPFLPFSSNSYYGSLLSAQSLLFFSLFLT